MSKLEEKLGNFLAEVIPSGIVTTRDIAIAVYKRAWQDRKELDMRICSNQNAEDEGTHRAALRCYYEINSEE